MFCSLVNRFLVYFSSKNNLPPSLSINTILYGVIYESHKKAVCANVTPETFVVLTLGEPAPHHLTTASGEASKKGWMHHLIRANPSPPSPPTFLHSNFTPLKFSPFLFHPSVVNSFKFPPLPPFSLPRRGELCKDPLFEKGESCLCCACEQSALLSTLLGATIICFS